MKRFLILLMAVTASFHLYAQQGSVTDRFFQKYENDKDFTLINITPKMFSMFAKINTDDEDGKKLLSVIQKLKSLRVLEKENTREGMLLYKEAAAFLESDFEELMTVHERGYDLKFMVKEGSHGRISELIMLIGSSREFMAMSLTGDIDLSEISLIARSVNIKGMDKLKNVKKKM